MSKQVRNIIVAVCVLAVLGVTTLLLYLLPGKKTTASSGSSSSASSSISLLSLKSGDIKSLHVQNAAGSYTITHASGDTYTVDGLREAPVNQSTITSNLAEAASITASSLVASNVTDLSPYGLATPTATLDITTADGTTTTVKVGGKIPTGSGNYVLKPGTSDVYISSTFTSYDFSGSVLDYAAVSLASLSTDAKISRYTLAGTARTQPIVVDVTESAASATSGTSSSGTTYTYKVKQPLEYDANETNAGAITTALQALSASKVADTDVSAASLAKYGLQNPAYTLTYTVNGADTTLSFGSTASDGTIYTMSSDKKAVYSVDTSTASFYKFQLGDLLSTTVYMKNIDTLKTLTLQAGSETHTYTFSGSGDSLVVKEGDKKLSTDNFRHFYQHILILSTRGTADKPTGVSPMLTITATYNDGSAQETLDFLPVGSDKAFFELNGKGAMYLYQSDFSNLMQLAQDLAAGKSIAEP